MDTTANSSSSSTPPPAAATRAGENTPTAAGGGGSPPVRALDASTDSAGAEMISETPPSRKRKRDSVAGAAAEGAGSGGGETGRTYNCSVCGRKFRTPQAMFGHMRAHPDRGWTGAHPPPAFRAEEEFADLRSSGEDGGAVAAEEGKSYRVPDLNKPPPSDA